MATPSVLTVPSMYGDGILYSGPSAYGSEIASQPVDLLNDFLKNQNGVIVDANTFTSSGGSLDGIRSKDSSFTLPVGTAFEIEIRGTTTSNGITLGSFSGGGNEYGSGFGVHRFVSLNNRLFIRQRDSAGTTTITYLSIKQVTQGSDFEFTRDTSGTRINEEGYIEDVPYNFAQNSEDIDGTGWSNFFSTLELNSVLAPDGTQTADKIISTSASGGRLDCVVSNGMSNTQYTTSFYAKANNTTAALCQIYEDSSGTFLATLDYTNLINTETWTRITITYTTTVGGNIRSQIIKNMPNGESVFFWGMQVVKGDKPKNYLPTTDRKNLPRLNYPVYGGCPSLLVEPQRTNRNTESEDLSQWIAANGSVSTDLIVNPTGNTNKSYWIPDTTNNFHHIDNSSSVTSGQQYTISIFLKPDGSDFLNFVILNTPTGNVNSNSGPIVNIKNGTKVGFFNSDYDVDIVSYGNGWNRYAWTVTTNATTLKLDVNPIPTSSVSSYNGNGNNGIYVYGLQVEEGSYPTSYMPTSGGTFTRNEDKALYAGLGTTDTFNDSEGVLFIETEALVNEVNARGICINSGNGNNRVLISYPSSSASAILGYVQSAAGSGASMSAVGVDTTQKHKVAIKYKVNDASLFIDGVKRGQDPSVAMPVGLKQLDFTNGIGAGTAEYEGNLNAIAVYKTALTDTELANLTSYNNHDLFIPYRSRMQMISADQELQCTEHDITRFL